MSTSATESKLRSLEEAAETIADGSTIAIGGLSMNSAPMAFVRALARRKVRDLTVVAIVHGMPIEWLVAAGCVRTVVSGLVSLEGFGLAPRFRAAVQAGQVEIEEYSEHTLICRLQAAAYRIPYMPTKAGLGTDMLALHPRRPARSRIPPPASGSSPAPHSPSTSRSSTARPPMRAATSASTPSSSGWTPTREGGGNDYRHGRADRPGGELPRRAAPHHLSALHRRDRGRGSVGGLSDLLLPALLLRRRLLPLLRRGACRPGLGAVVLGRANRRARDPRAFLDANGGARTLLSIARRTM